MAITEKSYVPERATSVRHFLTVIFKRLWVIFVVVVLALGIGAYKILQTPPQFEASAKLLLERDPELEKALLLRISSSGRSEDANFSYTQESEIMTARPVLERVIFGLKLFGFDDTTRFASSRVKDLAMQDALVEIGEHLSIVPSADPNILRVKYKSDDPQLCTKIVNELVTRYIEYRFEIFSDDQNIAYLNRQIEEAAGRLNELQQKRAEFQSEGTLYTPDREGDLLFTRLSDFENRAAAIRLERIAKEAKLKALRDVVRSGSFNELPAIDLGQGNQQMTNILTLKDQLRTLEYERDNLRQKYTDSYVEVQDKNQEISALRTRINGDIFDIIGTLESSIRSLSNEEATLHSNAAAIQYQIRGLSGKELEMSKQSRGIAEAEELYSMLLRQREEAKLSRSKKEMVVRVKVISPATVPLEPLPGNRIMKFGLVLFLGLFAGISLAFFMDFFDHSIKSADDVQRYLQLDLLASIRSFE
jgi:succinoglycan biosynthesis transport protein ExoP